MPNVFDYLEWRGDLTFEESPLCDVDNLIFCLLSYVDLDGIVPADPCGERVTIRKAAAEYFFTHREESDRPLGLIVPADILTLFRRMAMCTRYKDLPLTGYMSSTSEARAMQFCALTVWIAPEEAFVAFRGTDDSIVGWREDFNLAYMDAIPSQRKAAQYLNGLDVTPDTKLYVGGHSKGGNLAVWGAVHAEERVRAQIVQVYSNDGPGFSEGTVSSEAYRALSDRIRIILPDDSLVGLLLDHDERYTVVRSNRRGLFQHDGLSWEVLGSGFIPCEGLSKKGVYADTVVRRHIDAMSKEERRDFIRLMFTLIESTGAKTLTELHAGKARAALTMLRSFKELPRQEQETVAYLWSKLVGGKEVRPRREHSARDIRRARRPNRSGRVKVSVFPLLLP